MKGLTERKTKCKTQNCFAELHWQNIRMDLLAQPQQLLYNKPISILNFPAWKAIYKS